MSKSSLALSNLRAVVILIVLAFHSVLAYLDFLPAKPYPFDDPPFKWQAFPIIDSQRWMGFDLFCAWQDVYLMSFMFFLSGLFVWPSLMRKGSGKFLADRLRRIGLPLIVVVLLVMPIAYYPTYRVSATDPSVAAYWQAWWALPFWPSGPLWFLWQLLLFDLLAAGLFKFAPQTGSAPRRVVGIGAHLSAAIFFRPGRGIGGGLRPVGADLHAVEMDPFRRVRFPTESAAALPGVFPRRTRHRRLRPRPRPAFDRGRTGPTLGDLARGGAGLLAGLDGLHGADIRRRRQGAHRAAACRRPQLRRGLRERLLLLRGGVSALWPAPLVRSTTDFPRAPMVCIWCTMYLSSGCSMPCWTFRCSPLSRPRSCSASPCCSVGGRPSQFRAPLSASD